MRSPKDLLGEWPLVRQALGADRLGRGSAVKSKGSRELRARTAEADRVVKSVCPYCAVGCAQNVFVKDDRVVQIEGDPDAPHSRGRLCPKGSATLQLTTGSSREEHVLYRRPYGAEWERLDLATAMEMIADRVVATRAEGWEWEHDGSRTRRCMSIAGLGGATLDNEENYLIKKLLTALGIIQIENQARVCHSSTVVGLGTSFGRGASSTLPGDLQNSDLIVLEGSNMAEAHPVAFQWVMEAKARGATVIHVDPHYSRTSALADRFVPLRPGTDIAFLGGIINHVISTESDFREYVLAYTNAPVIIGEEFTDVDAGGIFSGFDPNKRAYDPASWQYEGAFMAAAAGQRDQEGNLDAVPPGATAAATLRIAAPRRSISRCSIRAASGRSSSVTTPPTRRRWWSGSAACRRTCSPTSAACSSRTQGGSARPRSSMASAGRSTRSARSTSAPPRCCNCCWGTWAVPVAA
jgi:formate dehydrogenase major subunit